MGKGTIGAALGGGRFTVMVHYDRTRSDAEIVKLTAQNVSLDGEITDLATKITEAENQVTFAQEAVDAKLEEYNQAQSDGKARIKAAELNLETVLAEYVDITSAEQANIDQARDALELAKKSGSQGDVVAAQDHLESVIAAAEGVYGHVVATQARAALADAEAEVKGAENNLRTAQADLEAAWKVRSGLKRNLETLRLRKTANTKRIDFLNQNIPADVNKPLWCTDYTQSLSGEVGLIEIGRIDKQEQIIRPGSSAAYNAARDGVLEPVLSGTPAGVFLNLALLPGAARWKPRYRTGTISGLSGDTCNITLDALRLGAVANVNPSSGLYNVPIEYMGCNGAAFQNGDRVVVEFAGLNPAVPKVIGFISNPRSCSGMHLEGPEMYPATIDYTYICIDGMPPYAWSVSPNLTIVSNGGPTDDFIVVTPADGGATAGTATIACTDGNSDSDLLEYDLSGWLPGGTSGQGLDCGFGPSYSSIYKTCSGTRLTWPRDGVDSVCAGTLPSQYWAIKLNVVTISNERWITLERDDYYICDSDSDFSCVVEPGGWIVQPTLAFLPEHSNIMAALNNKFSACGYAGAKIVFRGWQQEIRIFCRENLAAMQDNYNAYYSGVLSYLD